MPETGNEMGKTTGSDMMPDNTSENDAPPVPKKDDRNILYGLVGVCLLLCIVLAVAAIIDVRATKKTQTANPEITWDECVREPGSTILTTYPGQCITTSGKRVTETVPRTQKTGNGGGTFATPPTGPGNSVPGSGQSSAGGGMSTDKGITQTCTVRPSCLDAKPACKIAEPAEGWCPAYTPAPTQPCVPKPTCPAGTHCALPLFYPAGGWCEDTITPSVTP